MSDEEPPRSEIVDEEAGRKDIGSSTSPPKEVQRALQKLAQNKPDGIFEMMTVAAGMGNPLHSKMEPQHITQVLELAVKHDEREYELSKTKETNSAADRISIRRYVFAGFVSIMFLIVLILFLFENKPEILVPLITGIAGLGAGFLGGLGMGKQLK